MMGSDQDSRMIESAQRNAERALPALAASAISWQASPVAQARAIASKGVLVSNPPYGKRLEKADETPDQSFERSLSEVLKREFAGWQAWLLTDNLKLEGSMRLKASRRIPVYNGDIECRWMRFDMVSGSMRDKT